MIARPCSCSAPAARSASMRYRPIRRWFRWISRIIRSSPTGMTPAARCAARPQASSTRSSPMIAAPACSCARTPTIAKPGGSAARKPASPRRPGIRRRPAVPDPAPVLMRKASAADIPAVLRLYAQPDLDDGKVLPVDQAVTLFERFARYPDYTLYVAEQDREIVGSFAL